VHAHTGVKTHLIGPGRGRMVARSDRCTPSQVDAACERRAGSDGRVERRAWRKGREGTAPLVGRWMWSPSSTVPAAGASRTYRTLTTVPIVYIGDTVQVVQVVQVVPVVLYGYTLG
jgi:hypothetical protein